LHVFCSQYRLCVWPYPQYHLNETDPSQIKAFNEAMPDVGFDWIRTVGSGSTLLSGTATYAGFLEALAVRWAAGDMSRLQPTMAAPCWSALMLLANMRRKKAGQEELELLGRSGSKQLAEGTNAMGTLFAGSGGARDETST
jgi:hypothetical protein